MRNSLYTLLCILLATHLSAQTIFEQNGKFGLKDLEGQEVVPATYTQIIDARDGYFLLCQAMTETTTLHKLEELPKLPEDNNYTSRISLWDTAIAFPYRTDFRYGLYHKDWTKPMPAIYEAVYVVQYAEAFAVKQDGTYYLYNPDKHKLNKKVSFQQFKPIGSEMGAFIQKNGKWGKVSSFLTEEIKPIYEDVQPVANADDLWALKKNGEFVFFDAQEEAITMSEPVEGYEFTVLKDRFFAKKNGKWGVKTKNMDVWIIDPQFEGLQFYSQKTLIAKQNGKWGLIDAEGNTVHPFQYKDIQAGYHDLLAIQASDTYRLYTWKDGELKEPYKNLEFHSLVQLPTLTPKQRLIDLNDKKGLFEEGKGVVIPPKFDDLQPYTTFDFTEEYDETTVPIATILDSKKGLYIHRDGAYTEALPPIYDDFVDITDFSGAYLPSCTKFIVKQNGKWGIASSNQVTESINIEYDSIQYVLGAGNLLICQKGGNWGIIEPTSRTNSRVAVPFEYEEIRQATNDAPIFEVKKNGKWGKLQVDGLLEKKTTSDASGPYRKPDPFDKKGDTPISLKTLTPTSYDAIKSLKKLPQYTVIQKNGKFGLLNATGKEILPTEFDEINYESKLTVLVKQDGKIGSAALNTGHVLFKRGIEELFSLKWSSEIGQTTFRTNIMFANNSLIVGSNGTTRNQADDKDGLFFLDTNTGEVSQLLRPQSEGKTDINGQAIDGNKVFFGNENGQAFCYQLSGELLWKDSLFGEIENSPTLADVNSDGIKDAIFATDKGHIYALNGTDGTKLWEFKDPEGGFYMATPAVFDISKDGTPDVFIGSGGRSYFYAINGKNGQQLWRFKTKSTAGFVDGSGVHASASILLESGKSPQIVVAESYGIIHFLNTEGKWQRYIANSLGIFSTPVFSPNGLIINGASWNGKGNVDLTLINGEEDWAFQESGNVYYAIRKTQMDGAPSTKTSSSAFVADVLGDGSYQVGIADEAGKFQIINEKGEVLDILQLEAGVEAPLFVGDIDNDGLLEIVIACTNGKIYCYDTKSSGNVFWGQFRGNNANTGVIKK